MTTAALPLRQVPRLPIGRTFLHPAFDYLLIGGGLSLVVTGWLYFGGTLAPAGLVASWQGFEASLPALLLLFNSAHFAASTVRLYTKPGAHREFPFLTRGLPLLTLALLTLSIAFAPLVGRHLQALYLSWSPFHYAAQTYGLALMYCYRSGCALAPGERRLLRVACLVPFLQAVVRADGSGFAWVAPGIWDLPFLHVARPLLLPLLAVATFTLPLVWLVQVTRAGRGAPPTISMLLVLSNGAWWTLLAPMGAFAVATVFHAVQYLVIVTVFHVKDRVSAADNRHGRLYHSLWFYGACVLLGHLLFDVWPRAYVAMGFGLAESMLLVVAVINVHHFVVDAFIWRLRKGSNSRIVSGEAQ